MTWQFSPFGACRSCYECGECHTVEPCPSCRMVEVIVEICGLIAYRVWSERQGRALDERSRQEADRAAWEAFADDEDVELGEETYEEAAEAFPRPVRRETISVQLTPAAAIPFEVETDGLTVTVRHAPAPGPGEAEALWNATKAASGETPAFSVESTPADGKASRFWSGLPMEVQNALHVGARIAVNGEEFRVLSCMPTGNGYALELEPWAEE